MTASNLPPGCNANDIPGNRDEDMEWEEFHEGVSGDCEQNGTTPAEASIAWEIGVAALATLRDWDLSPEQQ